MSIAYLNIDLHIVSELVKRGIFFLTTTVSFWRVHWIHSSLDVHRFTYTAHLISEFGKIHTAKFTKLIQQIELWKKVTSLNCDNCNLVKKEESTFTWILGCWIHGDRFISFKFCCFGCIYSQFLWGPKMSFRDLRSKSIIPYKELVQGARWYVGLWSNVFYRFKRDPTKHQLPTPNVTGKLPHTQFQAGGGDLPVAHQTVRPWHGWESAQCGDGSRACEVHYLLRRVHGKTKRLNLSTWLIDWLKNCELILAVLSIFVLIKF